MSMNKLIELIRLVLTTQHTDRVIGLAVAASKTTVGRYRKLAAQHGLRWDDLKDLNDTALLAIFNAPPGGHSRLRQPDLEYIHAELVRAKAENKPITQQMLWEAYREVDETDACSITHFNNMYRKYAGKTKLAMRQRYAPGKEAQVDFSGKRPGYMDQQRKAFVPVELFIGVLTFSNFTYAVAVPSQKLEDWIEANLRMLEYFGGAPEIITCDNLKSAVSRAGRNARINQTYQAFARHYDALVVPARPSRPRDKSKVEGHVRLMQRWIIGRLRDQTFFSCKALNDAIAMQVDEFNNRVQRRYGKSRRQRFDELERAALKPLPAERYEFAEMFGEVTVPSDYHVPVRRHWYSVPHNLVGDKVYARASYQTVEIFRLGKRVATHRRSSVEGDSSTLLEHCPPNHLSWARRTPEYMQEWAAGVGENLAAVVRQQFTDKPRHEALKACDSLRGLARGIGNAEIEAVARYALRIKSPTVKSMRSIASSCIHRMQHGEPLTSKMPSHDNVRGPDYYIEIEESEGA